MTAPFSRAMMVLATCCFGECRRDWSAAMEVEFEAAVADGRPLSFAFGCLVAAWRHMLTHDEGWLTLTSYVLALCVMIPMAAIQIGCALFGFPYLYPNRGGLPDALLLGAAHEGLLRGIYQAAVPSLALILLLLGAAHLRIAWAMLDGDWARVRRFGAFAAAAAISLVLFMSVLFLDSTEALLQAAVLMIELSAVSAVAWWHRQQRFLSALEPPG